MPILLNDIDTATKATTAGTTGKIPKTKPLTAKFFSSHLTGRGQKTGLLHQGIVPGRYSLGSNRSTMGTPDIRYRSTSSSSGITNRIIPVGTVVKRAYEQGYGRMTVPVPDQFSDFAVCLTEDDDEFGIWASCDVQGLVLHEDSSGDATTKDLMVSYRTMIYVVPPVQNEDTDALDTQAISLCNTVIDTIDNDDPQFIFVDDEEFCEYEELAEDSLSLVVTVDDDYRTRAVLLNSAVSAFPITATGMSATPRAWAVADWSYAPVDDASDLPWDTICQAAGLSSMRQSHMLDKLLTFYSEYSTYDNIVASAQRWSSDRIAEDVHSVIEALVSTRYSWDDEQLTQAVYELRYLESYGVPLSAYRRIYHSIMTLCEPRMASRLVKQNVNILMNSTLDDLGQRRNTLERAPQSMTTVPVQGRFSTQQLAAVRSTEPLVIVQAGAGSGKSTVVLGRVDHLTRCGVNPSDITVLSFTNAAADNIIKRNPSVRSMTIARMIHDLYSTYFPTHELSSVETIANSLMIYMPGDPFALNFSERMRRLEGRNSEGAHTSLNNFIEAHLEQVITALDLIKQTSLELEIILAYQMIDRMPLPQGLNIRHLIIDEVQDNSVFEFIYLLRLVNKLECSLFLVGDASQTLYEFRSANPKALNALEASGVFTPYKLETNYRSNQEILDFANVHLADIEANQLAQISLRANSLAPVTAQSFQDKVHLIYEHYTSDKKFFNDLPSLLLKHTRAYAQECLDRGEHVAYLAFTRREAFLMQKRLEELFPGRSVISMVSDRRRSSTFFSTFVKEHWGDIEALDPANASFAFSKEVVARNIARYPNAEKTLLSMISEWWGQQSINIQGWVHEQQMNLISKETFFERLKKSILDYEIRYNSLRDALMHRSNEERKVRNMETKADFIVSTVHGVKGLEFDNVVLLHKADNDMSEDRKRLYYVALTRAMHTELILSHGTTLSSRITSDYNMLVKSLEDSETNVGSDDDTAVDAVVVDETAPVAWNDTTTDDAITIDEPENFQQVRDIVAGLMDRLPINSLSSDGDNTEDNTPE